MHPTVRQRQNVVATAGQLIVTSLADRALIAVPSLPADRMWDPRVSDFWVDAWQSPMRVEWDLADTHALVRVAYLMDEFYRAVDVDLPAPMTAFDADGDPVEASDKDRLIGLKMKASALVNLSNAIMSTSARLGLDPFARRSLQWLLVRTEKDEAERDESKARAAKVRAETPKRPRKYDALG